VFYGWSEPLRPHTIVLEFYYGGLGECPIRIGENVELDFDSYLDYLKIDLKYTDNLGTYLHVRIIEDGITKVIEISEQKVRKFF